MVGLDYTEVSQGLDLLCHAKTLLIVDARLLWLRALSVVIFTLPQVTLQGDQNELNIWTILGDLADPFGLDILEGVRRVDGEAEHDSVGVVVAEGS